MVKSVHLLPVEYSTAGKPVKYNVKGLKVLRALTLRLMVGPVIRVSWLVISHVHINIS